MLGLAFVLMVLAPAILASASALVGLVDEDE